MKDSTKQNQAMVKTCAIMAHANENVRTKNHGIILLAADEKKNFPCSISKLFPVGYTIVKQKEEDIPVEQ